MTVSSTPADLAAELETMQAEVFEIADHSDADVDLALACSCTSCCSTSSG